MRELHVDFIRTIPPRAASHGTAFDLRPCSFPPNAVAVVTQMTCPTSRFAEIDEPGILLFMRAPARNVVMVQSARLRLTRLGLN
jgi:hypothetical protein